MKNRQMMIKITATEKTMLVIAAIAAVAGSIWGYPTFVAGLGMGAAVSLLLQRWQMAGNAGLDSMPSRKAFNRYFFRALVRSLLALILLILAQFGGVEFLLGTLLGLVLQVLAYMWEAVLIIMERGDNKLGFSALGEIMGHVQPHVVFHLGTVPVYSTVVNTWIIMAVLLTGIFLVNSKFTPIPRGIQHPLEMIMEFLNNLLEEAMGKEGRRYLPLVATLFIFILSLNFAWLIPGMKPPTMDYSTTAAFAVTTIILVQLIGIRKRGLVGYIRHFFQPVPLLFPLNLIEELVKPVSLSLRLFGNMFGEEMVVIILFMMLPFLLPTPVMFLGILMGFIQAFVFTLLTITYIGNFIHGH